MGGILAYVGDIPQVDEDTRNRFERTKLAILAMLTSYCTKNVKVHTNPSYLLNSDMLIVFDKRCTQCNLMSRYSKLRPTSSVLWAQIWRYVQILHPCIFHLSVLPVLGQHPSWTKGSFFLVDFRWTRKNLSTRLHHATHSRAKATRPR